MTPEQYLQKIKKKLSQLNVVEDIVMPAAIHATDSWRQRIFIKGDFESGKQNYSVEPMYAGKSQFKNKGAFKARGKSGKGKFKNGAERKTMYLEQGYKQLRQVQGYESSFVNFHYYGDLFTNTQHLAVDGDSVIVRLRPLNMKKVEGQEKRFGADTFKHTKQERAQFIKDVKTNMANYFK